MHLRQQFQEERLATLDAYQAIATMLTAYLGDCAVQSENEKDVGSTAFENLCERFYGSAF